LVPPPISSPTSVSTSKSQNDMFKRRAGRRGASLTTLPRSSHARCRVFHAVSLLPAMPKPTPPRPTELSGFERGGVQEGKREPKRPWPNSAGKTHSQTPAKLTRFFACTSDVWYVAVCDEDGLLLQLFRTVFRRSQQDGQPHTDDLNQGSIHRRFTDAPPNAASERYCVFPAANHDGAVGRGRTPNT